MHFKVDPPGAGQGVETADGRAIPGACGGPTVPSGSSPSCRAGPWCPPLPWSSELTPRRRVVKSSQG